MPAGSDSHTSKTSLGHMATPIPELSVRKDFHAAMTYWSLEISQVRSKWDPTNGLRREALIPRDDLLTS